jgi:NTE family protein
MTANPRTAIVLSGGVAKGAFEAGALEVLVEHGLRVSQVVGTSSGALNATMLAGAVRAGRERDAMKRLVTLWREDATWLHILHVNVHEALEGRGLSDSKRILQLMRDELPPVLTAALYPIRLRIIVAALRGVTRQLAHRAATSFEAVLSFDGHDLDDEAGRERIYRAAAASTAFPLVYQPVDIPGLGPCCDGGAVNDTPVKLAADGGADRVIVIAPYPAQFTPATVPEGVEFLARLVDVLIHERLYRDLRDAEEVNLAIARVKSLVDRGVLSNEQLTRVLDAFDMRPLEIITIRPKAALPGNPFAGFLHRDIREQYIAAGQSAAREVVASLAD